MNRIKELRLEKNISVKKLVKELDISRQYFYDLEKGERRLNETVLRKLSNIFNASTDYILGNEEMEKGDRICENNNEYIANRINSLDNLISENQEGLKLLQKIKKNGIDLTEVENYVDYLISKKTN